MRNKLRRTERGFTLVELLVVIAIIAVLATIILPGMGNIRRQARFLKCAKNLQGLYNGLAMYEGEYKDYPRGFQGKAFWNLLRDETAYVASSGETAPLFKQGELYVCPVNGGKADEGSVISKCDYQGPGFPITYALTEDIMIGADILTNHDLKQGKPVNVLYFGGRVSEVKPGPGEWQNLVSPPDGQGLEE